MNKLAMDIRPDSSILGTYKNQSYKIESAFAEFIDNSTQSFFTNRDALKKIGQNKVKVDLEIYPEYIKIHDNAYGMELDDFSRAVKLNSPPEDKSGRSEKGMGLKTAATCLGSFWSVETTQFNSKNKYIIEMDVDDISINAPDTIDADQYECYENEHFTTIYIKNLNKKITPNKVQSLMSTLSEIYAIDIRNGDLELTINKQPVLYEAPELWINPDNNSEYKTVFNRKFEVDGQDYCFEGWVGIRTTGNTEFSGLNIFRKGRVIKMHYRPTKLLGKPNSFSYQRITGEIYLKGDNWEPSYTKDELMWEGEIEEKFIAEIQEAAGWLIKKSCELRKDEKVVSKEKQDQISTNISKSFSTVNSEEISKIITTNEENTDIPKNNNSNVDNDMETTPTIVSISNVDYIFYVNFVNNDYDNWIDLKTRENNEFDLKINSGLPYFENYKTSNDNIELMQKIVITICISIITSKNSGNKDAYKIIQLINSIVTSIK